MQMDKKPIHSEPRRPAPKKTYGAAAATEGAASGKKFNDFTPSDELRPEMKSQGFMVDRYL